MILTSKHFTIQGDKLSDLQFQFDIESNLNLIAVYGDKEITLMTISRDRVDLNKAGRLLKRINRDLTFLPDNEIKTITEYLNEYGDDESKQT